MLSKIKFGIDIFIESEKYKNYTNIGLVCNNASVTSTGVHTLHALLNNNNKVAKLFSPEHGMNSKGEDGKFMEHTTDKETNIPIISLYSDKLAPIASDLEGIDVVIIDLPDIGTRFYTYLWTATYVMESCQKYNIPVILLDRPNPIARDIVESEGPILNESLASFIGRFPIPITHNCTIGELSLYFKNKYFKNLNLEVIKVQNWYKSSSDSYQFTPTSPAIKDFFTTKIYPGTCLFEGLNINEGRGTEFPFTQFGAPWINNEILYQACYNKLIHAELVKVEYTPTDGFYKDQICYGLRIINIENQFKPVQYIINLIKIIHETHPNELNERDYCTNVNPNGENHLDKLLGLEGSLDKIKKGNINTSVGFDKWIESIQTFLLY